MNSLWSRRMKKLAMFNKRRGSGRSCPTRSFWEFGGKHGSLFHLHSPTNKLILGATSLVKHPFSSLESRLSVSVSNSKPSPTCICSIGSPVLFSYCFFLPCPSISAPSSGASPLVISWFKMPILSLSTPLLIHVNFTSPTFCSWHSLILSHLLPILCKTQFLGHTPICFHLGSIYSKHCCPDTIVPDLLLIQPTAPLCLCPP